MIENELLRRRLAQEIDKAEDRWMAMPASDVWRDCATPCADVLHAALGFDPMAAFRNRYRTPRGYLRVMRRDGYRSLEELLAGLAAQFGWRQIAADAAMPGDIGIGVHGEGKAFILHRGGPFWIGIGQRGLAALQSGQVLLAFKVA